MISYIASTSKTVNGSNKTSIFKTSHRRRKTMSSNRTNTEQEIQEPELQQVPQHEKCEALFWDDIQQGDQQKVRAKEQQKAAQNKSQDELMSGGPKEVPEVHRQLNVNFSEEMSEPDYSTASYVEDDREFVRLSPLTSQDRIILLQENKRLQQTLQETQKERDNYKCQLVDTRDELEKTQLECNRQIEKLQKKLLKLRSTMHPRTNRGWATGLMKEVTRKKERVRRLRARNENCNSTLSASTCSSFEDSCSLSSHEVQDLLYPIVSEDNCDEIGRPEALSEKIRNIDLLTAFRSIGTREKNTSENQHAMLISPKREADAAKISRLSAKIDLPSGSEKKQCVQESIYLGLKSDNLSTKIALKDKQINGLITELSKSKDESKTIQLLKEKGEDAVDSCEVEDILLHKDLQYLKNDDISILSRSSVATSTQGVECSHELFNRTKRTSVLERRLQDLLGVNKDIEDVYFQLKESNPVSADQFETQHPIFNNSQSRFAELFRKLSRDESYSQEMNDLQHSKQIEGMERRSSSQDSSFPVGKFNNKNQIVSMEPDFDRYSSAIEQLEYELLLAEDIAYLQEDFGSLISHFLSDTEVGRCLSVAEQLDDKLLLEEDIAYLREGFGSTLLCTSNDPERDKYSHDVERFKDELLLAEDIDYLIAGFGSISSSILNDAMHKIEILSSRLEALFALKIITDCAQQIECSILEQDFVSLEKQYLELENMFMKYQENNSIAAMKISSLEVELGLSRKRNEKLNDEILLKEDILFLECDLKAIQCMPREASDLETKIFSLKEALYVAEDVEFLLTNYVMKNTDPQVVQNHCEGNAKESKQASILVNLQEADSDSQTTSEVVIEQLPVFLNAVGARSAKLQNQVEESRIALAKALEGLNSTNLNDLKLCQLSKLEASSIQYQNKNDHAEKKKMCNKDAVAMGHNEKTYASAEAMQSQIDELSLKVNLLEEQNLAMSAERDRIEQDEKELQETFAFISTQYAETCTRESRLSSEHNALKSNFSMLRFVFMEVIQLIEDEISLLNLEQNSETSVLQVGLQIQCDAGDVERLEPNIEGWDCEWINAACCRFKAKLKLLRDMNTARVTAIEDERMHLELKLEESKLRFETYMAELSTLRRSYNKERSNLEERLLWWQRSAEEEHATTEKLKAEVVRLQHNLESIMAEKKAMLQDNLSLRNEVTQLLQDKSEVEQNTIQIKGRCDRYEKFIDCRSSEIDVLIRANHRLENKLKVLEEESEQDHHDMLKRNSILDGLLKNSHHRMVKMEGDIERLTTKLEDTKGQLEKTLQQRSLLKAKLLSSEELLNTHSTMIQTLQNETNKLRIRSVQLSASSACWIRQRDLANQKVDEYRQRDEQFRHDVSSLWWSWE